MYCLTLCDVDGTLIAEVPEAPILPRFMHITADAIALSDDPDPDLTGDHVTTFQRVASSVWVDDEKAALFVRVVT